MEITTDQIRTLGRQVLGQVAGGQSYASPRPLLVLLAHTAGEEDLSSVVASLQTEREGARWMIQAATETAYLEVTGLVDQPGASDDARLVMRPLSALRRMTVDSLKILDDFSDVSAAATWTFEFNDGLDPVVLSSAGLPSRGARDAVEQLAAALQAAMG